ncbi:MAG: HAMP domain-containing histidine kinase [Caldilinea sp.]|nr:HAMP domain-containing histidine kinase [Caldilinea sp.]
MDTPPSHEATATALPKRWLWQRSLQARMAIAFSGAFLIILTLLTIWLGRAVYNTYLDAAEHDLEVAAFLASNALEDPLSGYAEEFAQYQRWEAERQRRAATPEDDYDDKQNYDKEKEEDEHRPTPMPLPPPPPEIILPRLQGVAATYARDAKARVTILDKNGHPVADSHYAIELIASQGNQPEVIAALRSDELSNIRVDEFTGALTLFAAAPIQQGSEILGVVQLSQPMQDVTARARELVLTIALAGVAAVLASTALAVWISRQLVRPVRRLEQAALATAQGDLTQQAPVQTSDELGALAQAFNTMVGAVRTMLEQQRAFVAHASHELRTPLTNIKLRIEAVRTLGDEAPDISQRYLAEIESEADRLTRLANALLDLAHLEGNPSSPPERAVDLAPMLDNAAAIMQLRAQSAAITLETAIPDALPPVKVHPEQIEEAVLNLLDNAIKYTPAGGRVTLTANATVDRLTVIVSDTGAGIPSEDLPHIFDRFYRVDKARSRARGVQDNMGSGAGLGLAIVKQLVEQNRGWITVESTPGQGANFAISFPLVA